VFALSRAAVASFTAVWALSMSDWTRRAVILCVRQRLVGQVEGDLGIKGRARRNGLRHRRRIEGRLRRG